MKNLLIIAFLMVAARVAGAQDFRAPVDRGQQPVRDTPQVADPQRGVGGAIPRAVRSGNPLQMLNPFAPREYGTGQDLVSYEQSDPFMAPHERKVRPQGIRLFSLHW